jgi:predicted transcriptional regulator
MPKLLTQAELELMQVLWTQGPSTVRAVHRHISAAREVAYTTIATVLKVLADKGFASTSKDGRALIYTAAVAVDRYAQRGVKHMVERLFSGNPVSLVRSLVASESLSSDEIDQLQALIDTARNSE